MFSADGEFVDYSQAVQLEGPVEAWLCDIERMMRWTLKEVLKACRVALKKNLSKRDKWIKEWCGQVSPAWLICMRNHDISLVHISCISFHN